MGAVRAIASVEAVDVDDFLREAVFEATAELGKGKDLIDLEARPELLDVFPARVVSRIVDAARKATTAKRDGDTDYDRDPDRLPARIDPRRPSAPCTPRPRPAGSRPRDLLTAGRGV